MKIAVFDPYTPRFTEDMVKWWRDNGHEVRVDRYYDPQMVAWADLIWFDTCDNNLLSATNPSQALIADWQLEGKNVPWDIHEHDLSNKKIVVRPIDIEVWQGHHAHENMWNVVDHCIFLAPHIRDMMMADSRPQASDMNIHTIQCGVDLSKWTFKKRGPGNQIAVVAERWVSKGVDYVVQIALKLPKEYEIHWLGKNNDYHWEHEYLKDAIKRWNLNIHLHEEYVDDLDQWLEDKNYLLSASKKEAFGYNIAEAMAKGIKPVIHHFYGAEHVWPHITWKSIDEAVEHILADNYDSESYLKYLKDHDYTIDQMMNKVMEAIYG